MTDWNKVLAYLEPKTPLFCPEEPSITQKVFLRSYSLEGLFGGAAGGGKSSALLMSALQYVDVPGYSAILFRRTYADLALPGALMDRFRSWISLHDDVHWNANSFIATFPSLFSSPPSIYWRIIKSSTENARSFKPCPKLG